MTSLVIYFGRHFLEAQGYTITNNIIFQDNMSSSSLEKNGHASSSKCTKHIKARYFFTKHYYDTGEIDLTKQMWADLLTKPLQGSKLREMQAILMNCSIDYSEESLFVSLEPPPSLITNDIIDEATNQQDRTFMRECVEVSPPSARPCTIRKIVPKGTSTCPKVTWKDSVTHNHQ